MLAGDLPALDALDSPPVLMTSEPDPARPDEWRLDAYFDREPGEDAIRLIVSLVAGRTQPTVERLADRDWVTLSQAGLEPIRAGRFFVHTPAHRTDVPPGAIAFEIDAGRAFGTGHHETTTGCLEALDALDALGARDFRDIADVGTGTGLLAFAAHRLWPRARVVASDIDPVAIDVAAANARVNDVPVGDGAGQVALLVADGMGAADLRARAPYDLIVANILAGPLIALAPDFAAMLGRGGTLMLAGLLDAQADDVEAACRAVGIVPGGRRMRGDWPTLLLEKA